MKVQRHLAPTAAPLSFADVIRGGIGLIFPGHVRTKVESEMRTYFDVRHVFLFSSGKAAIGTILTGLKNGSFRRQVVLPAYTCYSVPSAVHKAGLEVTLCDVDTRTFDYNMAELRATVNDQTLAIIAPNPLGHPADMDRIMTIAQSVGAFVIEDAAQAMGVRHDGRLLGTRGHAGIFSLGRGKNVSVGSGGVVVTNSDLLAETIGSLYQELPIEPVAEIVTNAAMVLATKILLHPMLYWLPAGLPFIGLGETRYEPDFPIYAMDGLRAGLLLSWEKRLEESNAERMTKLRMYEEELSPELERPVAEQAESSVYLRLPVLMPSAEHKAGICRQSSEEGLGISAMYPEPVSGIPALHGEIGSKRFLGAEAVAARLVTLPLHRYVTKTDVERIVGAMNRWAHRVSRPLAPAGEAMSNGTK